MQLTLFLVKAGGLLDKIFGSSIRLAARVRVEGHFLKRNYLNKTKEDLPYHFWERGQNENASVI